jgi:hypothetical protein
MALTLGTRLARLEETRFAGREIELRAFDDLFVPEPPVSVVHLHGPGGIGKSTLLRAIIRVGERRGWRPFLVDGRDLPPDPSALEDALEGVREEERALLLLDTYERLGALDGYLRGRLLPELSHRSLVVLAGRRPPGAGWYQDGWETLLREVELGPLPEADGEAVLERHGMEDPDERRRVLRRAGGSPLALVLAARAGEGEGVGDLSLAPLVRRLVDTEVTPARRAVLDLASIPRVTTRELLGEVLGTDGGAELEWLAGLSFVEALGEGVTLHDLVRRAVRDEVRARSPERERELRRRVADHLYHRALEGQPLLTVDLSHLAENELIRSFYGWEGSIHYRMDQLRDGDAETVRERLMELGYEDWWEPTQPFFDRAPERVGIARDGEDRLAGMLIAVTPATAPAFAAEDPVLGPWLEDARRRAPDGNAVLWRDVTDFATPRDERFADAPGTTLQGMLNMAGVLQSGLPNPRYFYLPIDVRYTAAFDFAQALGGTHLTHLDTDAFGRQLECWLIDHGPAGGLLGAQRALVYAELGLAPPAPPEAPAGGEAVPAVAIDAAAVRAALRDLHVPSDLARNPLASGTGVEARAASVRARLSDASDRAFGPSGPEQQLRAVLVGGYLEPAASHELAADALHLSRSAYFRRLRAAVDRVAEYLAAEGPGPG